MTGVVRRPHAEPGPVATAIRLGVWVLLIVAVAYLAWRGVARSFGESGDLAVGYSAARVWLAGGDPYDPATLAQELVRAGGETLGAGELLERLRNVYVPTTIPLFAIIAPLPWPAAQWLMVAVNLAIVLGMAIGIVRLVGWPMVAVRSIALIAAILALAPIHTTMAFGQTGIVAVGALVAAALAERAGRPVASGVLFGLATVAKVQIGLPFVAYLVWRRRGPTLLAAAGVLAAATAIAILRMESASIDWRSGWLDNLAWLARPGGLNDPSLANPDRFSLVDLRYLIWSWLEVGGIDIIVVGVVGAAALAFMWLRRGRDARPDLLALAIVGVLGLLVSYHRYYDAVVLVLPIAWACSVLWTARWWLGAIVLVLAADFLLPMQSLLHELGERGLAPGWLTGEPLWTGVLLTQHVWALVLMSVVLLIAAAAERRAPAPSGVDPAAVVAAA